MLVHRFTLLSRCGFARYIIENHSTAEVLMVDIGAQENPIVGHHPKNAIKLVHFESPAIPHLLWFRYQKDIDAFGSSLYSTLYLHAN